MTALTVYYTTTNSTTTGLTTTANQLSETLGSGSATTKSTVVGTGTGWFELYSRGDAAAAGTGGSQGSQSGNGFIDDGTALEGQTIAAGTWSPAVRLQTNNATLTADIHVRVSKYLSGGTYSTIGDMSMTSQSITTALANYASFTGTSLSAMSFSTGDKLYVDVWVNITTNGGASNTAVKLTQSSVTNTGLTTSEVVTPGYSVSAKHFFICDGMGGIFS